MAYSHTLLCKLKESNLRKILSFNFKFICVSASTYKGGINLNFRLFSFELRKKLSFLNKF